MSRTQIGLLTLLLVQIALIALCRSTPGKPATPEDLFPNLDTATIRKLSIEEPAAKKSATLVRGADGWTVEEAEGFPADATRIEEILATLKKLRVARPVVTNKRYHEAFSVEDDKAAARVRAWADPQADPALDLLVGSSSNYRSTHVRRAGSDPVYEVRDLAAYDVRADRGAWIDKTLVDVKPEDVRRFSLTNTHGTVAFERADDVWKAIAPAGAAVDASKVQSLLATATNLRITDAAGKLDEAAQGFSTPSATLRLWVAETPATEAPATEREIVVRLGSSVEGRDGERYVTRSGLAYAGTIWDGSLSRLLEDDAKSFAPSAEPGS